MFLAGVAQLIGGSSHKPKSYGFDSWLERMLGCGFAWETTSRYFSLTLMFLSLPTSLSLSLKSMKMSSGEDANNKNNKNKWYLVLAYLFLNLKKITLEFYKVEIPKDGWVQWIILPIQYSLRSTVTGLVILWWPVTQQSSKSGKSMFT